ncbi:MAG: hypothetical protein VB142_09950 [Burkholderia sp.]
MRGRQTKAQQANLATPSHGIAVRLTKGAMKIGVRIDPEAWRTDFEAEEISRTMTPCPADLDG